MKKAVLLFLFLILISAIVFVCSRQVRLQGTYQGEIEGSLYTISIEGSKVNFFSSATGEHHSGDHLEKTDKNEYRIVFDIDSEYIIKAQSDKKIVLVRQNKEYAFTKKSDNLIWEEGYEYKEK